MASIKREPERRLVDIEAFMNYVGLGRNSAMRLGVDIGCRVKIGRRSLYDLRKTDQYLDSLTEVN